MSGILRGRLNALGSYTADLL